MVQADSIKGRYHTSLLRTISPIGFQFMDHYDVMKPIPSIEILFCDRVLVFGQALEVSINVIKRLLFVFQHSWYMSHICEGLYENE